MPIEPIFLIAVLVMSVVIHEVSHGYAAALLGDPTARLAGRLTLNPLRHLDLFGSIIVPGILLLTGGFVVGWAKPVPYNPYNLRGGKWGPAVVGAAGPAVNFLLALIFGLVVRALVANAVSETIISFAFAVAAVNVMLGLFNLLPVPPLDGSKVLFALLPYRLRHWENWLNANQWWLILLLLLLIINTPWLGRLVFVLVRLFTGV